MPLSLGHAMEKEDAVVLTTATGERIEVWVRPHRRRTCKLVIDAPRSVHIVRKAVADEPPPD